MAKAPLDEVPDEDEDEALLIDEHHVLDLSEVIRQGLLLVDPRQTLCRPDCAGLCPRCGGNRNLGECNCDEGLRDPRWAALQTLLSNPSDSVGKERLSQWEHYQNTNWAKAARVAGAATTR